MTNIEYASPIPHPTYKALWKMLILLSQMSARNAEFALEHKLLLSMGVIKEIYFLKRPRILDGTPTLVPNCVC